LDLGFDVNNTDEFLPGSFSPAGDSGIGSSRVLGSSVAPSIESESDMDFLDPLSDYFDRADDSLSLPSHLEDQSVLFVSDNAGEMLLRLPLDRQSYSMLSSSGFEYTIQPASGRMHHEYDFESSKVVPKSWLSEGFTSLSEEFTSLSDYPAVANKGHKTKYNTAKASPNKHKYDGMMTFFPTSQAQVKVVRIRMAYSPSWRKEIKLARNVGLCLRCRTRKLKASYLLNFHLISSLMMTFNVLMF
jgi:hypothetical protein